MAGAACPGEEPVGTLTSVFTSANAAAMPLSACVVEGEPMLVGPVMNGARAHTVATVVTSLIFTTALVTGHVPSADIIARLGLLPLPESPWVAVMKIWPPEGQV